MRQAEPQIGVQVPEKTHEGEPQNQDTWVGVSQARNKLSVELSH